MTLIADWAERPTPVTADATIDAARRIFTGDPALTALAVVSDALPVGLISRTVIMAADGELTGAQPVSTLMATPTLMSADAPAAEALDRLIAAGGCAEGVIVVERGEYVGLITQPSLLRALQGRTQAAAPRAEDRHRFVEALAREISTPMSGLAAVAQLLQRQPLSDDSQAYVQTILDASETVMGVVGDALDLADGEAGRLHAVPEPMVLRETMDEIQAEWVSRPSANTSVMVSYDGEPELGVMCDRGRMRQVFGNLIAAAVKTTRQGAVEASLKARVLPEGVRLEGRVRDAGQGLPPEQLARIFEAAAQGEDSGRIGWRGLGLPLSRLIVEAMGGSIRAEGNVGEGVTVTFELLAPRLEAAAEPASEAAGRSAEGGSVHVLVVDDNATNRMVAEGLCEMFDCTSECAEDGVEALEAARSGRFHLILMDIKMPRMDGIEATKAIRQLPGAAGRVPIVALTANADPEDAKTYIACGMSSVVEKPIKPERLLMAINAALEGAEAAAARAA